jgi:hypothetical protein
MSKWIDSSSPSWRLVVVDGSWPVGFWSNNWTVRNCPSEDGNGLATFYRSGRNRSRRTVPCASIESRWSCTTTATGLPHGHGASTSSNCCAACAHRVLLSFPDTVATSQTQTGEATIQQSATAAESSTKLLTEFACIFLRFCIVNSSKRTTLNSTIFTFAILKNIRRPLHVMDWAAKNRITVLALFFPLRFLLTSRQQQIIYYRLISYVLHWVRNQLTNYALHKSQISGKDCVITLSESQSRKHTV